MNKARIKIELISKKKKNIVNMHVWATFVLFGNKQKYLMPTRQLSKKLSSFKYSNCQQKKLGSFWTVTCLLDCYLLSQMLCLSYWFRCVLAITNTVNRFPCTNPFSLVHSLYFIVIMVSEFKNTWPKFQQLWQSMPGCLPALADRVGYNSFAPIAS